MNNEPEVGFDLEKMFLPEWATKPPTPGEYTHYTEEEEKRRDRRPGRRERGFRERDDRARERQKPAETRERQPRERRRRRQRRERSAPLPDVKVSFLINDETVELLIRQIKKSGRAFPLFEIANKLLDYPDRQLVKFEVKKKQNGEIVQPLYLCLLDETLWLSEADAVDYVLDKHFSTFYQVERVQTEPPKGKYTFVAQCGYSGVILGPPNHHDYLNKLKKLHQERFSHIPFDEYKMRVKIVRDEAVVKKWLEEQSWKTEYLVLNVPETIRLPSREAVVEHFKQNHLSTIIHQVESHIMSGPASREIPCEPLQRLVRKCWREEKRFPKKVATFLSQRFAEAGLHFFKWDRNITHVSVARPTYLDLESLPVSENVRRIIEYIREHPGCTRHELIEALAPTPAKPLVIAPEAQPQQPTQEQQQAPAQEQQAQAPAQVDEYTPEQMAVIAEIHWLIHQGHIIEFANGKMYVAKKPAPKPPRQEIKQQAKPEAEQAAQQPAEVAQQQQQQTTPVAEEIPQPATVEEIQKMIAEEQPSELEASAEDEEEEAEEEEEHSDESALSEPLSESDEPEIVVAEKKDSTASSQKQTNTDKS